MSSQREAATVEQLRGLWRRSQLVRADGSSDSTTWVRWLQGQRRFADLRQSPKVQRLRHVPDRRELTHEECRELARQEGFAGELTFEAGYFEWRRAIDYQPPAGRADAGSLHFESGVLVELGRDAPYLEHWHREPTAATPCWALDLELPVTAGRASPRALLLRVGGCFMFARERADPVTAGLSLEECVARAPTLEAAQALIDCEISFGEVRSGECFAILRSTLPWRVGERIDVAGWRILAREDQ